MTETGFQQQSEGLAARAIWLVGAGVVVVSAALVVIAWLLVVPPLSTERPVAAPSALEHGLFDGAAAGDAIRAAGVQRLERYDWVDRQAHVVRIPIERAIDAVAADPSLIGPRSSAITGRGSAGGTAGNLVGGGIAGAAAGEAGR